MRLLAPRGRTVRALCWLSGHRWALNQYQSTWDADKWVWTCTRCSETGVGFDA